MIYRRFGRTELSMPVLSCGGMRYQHKWSDVPPEQIPTENQANLEATIRRSLELGINHIETARAYGTSEMQLGRILPSLPRKEMIVQTKVAPCEDPGEFRRNFDKSMAYLGLDYVDLLGLHGINDSQSLQWSIGPNGCLAEARKLVKEGRARFVGFSTHASLDVILQAFTLEADGGFDYVNLHWYYITQRNWPAVEEATRRDMGVFIISPSDKGGKLYAPPPRLVELCRPLTPMAFNDLFCLAHPQVHTLSIGTSRPGDFDAHLQALPLLAKAQEVLAPILERLRQSMLEATGVEDPEAMMANLPEWEQIPGSINVPFILWLRNLALGWGMTDYAKMRYNLLGNGGHWFPGISAAKLDEVPMEAMRAAVQGSPWAQQIPEMLREAHDLLGAEAVKRLSHGG